MFLAKYWKYIATLLLVLAIFGYWKSLTTTIARQDKQIIELKVENILCTGTVDTLKKANDEFKRLTDIQNEEIAKNAEISKKHAIEDAKLIAKQKNEVKKWKDANQELLDAQLNSKPCVEAVDECYELLERLP